MYKKKKTKKQQQQQKMCGLIYKTDVIQIHITALIKLVKNMLYNKYT